VMELIPRLPGLRAGHHQNFSARFDVLSTPYAAPNP